MRPLSSSSRGTRGQASLDYVATLALVSVALAGLAGTVGGARLGQRIAGALRHGICVVSGALCSTAEARAAGHAPCTVRTRSSAETAGANVAVVRVGRDDTVLVEQRSDGKVAVSFADGWEAGGTVAVGLSLPRGSGELDVGAGVDFKAGRTYLLPSRRAAARFLATFARRETVGGEWRGAVRRLLRRPGGPRLPEPTETYVEGGAWADLSAAFSIPLPGRPETAPPLGVAADGNGAMIVGRRTAGPTRTWYVRAGHSGLAEAGMVLAALQLRGRQEVVLEIAERGGRAVEARLRAVAETGGGVTLPGASVDLATVATWARGATASAHAPAADGGVLLQAEIALDLRDPANRRAVEGVLRPGLSPLAWDDRVRALGRRLDVAGAVDVALFRTRREAAKAGLALPGAGGSYERVVHVRELLGAWSRRAGGPLRAREDCVEAARGARALA